MFPFGLLLAVIVGAASASPAPTCTVSNLHEALSVTLPPDTTCRFRACAQVLAVGEDTLLIRDGVRGAIVELSPVAERKATVGDLVEIKGLCRDNELNRRSCLPTR